MRLSCSAVTRSRGFLYTGPRRRDRVYRPCGQASPDHRPVEHGERIVVTRDSSPVAELHPLPRSSVGAAELIRRRKSLPRTDPYALRRDIDNLIDPSL
jgi:hypothetical protein